MVAAREDGVGVPVTNFMGMPLSQRMLREVAAKRAILAWLNPLLTVTWRAATTRASRP